MTIAQSLKSAITKLKINDTTDLPHLEAEILLSEIIKKPREFLLARGEKKLTAGQISKLQFQISKRLKGLPVAYLTGHKEFYGLDFKINQYVLIPRPETELMVEEALKLITRPAEQAGGRAAILVDVGTGSGCVIITLAKKIADCQCFATDISIKALAIAGQNAKTNHIDKKIKFIKGNLLEPILKNNKLIVSHRPLVILANLPYLAPNQIKNSPTIKYEPKSSLDGGPDGLKYYRRLFRQINELRTANRSPALKLRGASEPRDINALCEINPGQTAKIKQLIKRELPEASCQIKKDLSGLNRLAIIKII